MSQPVFFVVGVVMAEFACCQEATLQTLQTMQIKKPFGIVLVASLIELTNCTSKLLHGFLHFANQIGRSLFLETLSEFIATIFQGSESSEIAGVSL